MHAETTIKTVTIEQLKAGNPELAEALIAEGRAAGYEAGKAEGVQEGHAAGLAEGLAKGQDEGRLAGATAERERIKDVEAQALPGHAELIQTLKFDGKTTGPEAAVKILQVEKEARTIHRDKLKADKDLAEPIQQGVTQPGTEQNPDASGASGKEALREKKIKEYQAAHPGTDYRAAAFAVSRECPDLFKGR